MKASQQSQQKNEDIIALIDQEYSLVVDGKSAQHLVKLLHSYQTEYTYGRIERVSGLLEKYAHSLLINGQYRDLSFLLTRYDKNIPADIKSSESLRKVAEFGKREDLKSMWDNLHKYVKQLGNSKTGQRIIQAAIGNTLATLSKYYLNFKVQDWKNITNTSESEVEAQAEIKDKYIQLKQRQSEDNCLQSKLKELVYVASRMSQLQ